MPDVLTELTSQAFEVCYLFFQKHIHYTKVIILGLLFTVNIRANLFFLNTNTVRKLERL